MFLAAHAAPRRRRRRFFWTGGGPPPPTEIDRRAAADTMMSAHSSNQRCSQLLHFYCALFNCRDRPWWHGISQCRLHPIRPIYWENFKLAPAGRGHYRIIALHYTLLNLVRLDYR